MSVPWTLAVLRAFRDAMNAAKVESAPDVKIGWPTAAFVEAGPYRPFVWFDEDRLSIHDGTTSHEMTVVTGVVFAQDPSVTGETELEQAMAGYYAMRVALAVAVDTAGSAFNQAFKGAAQPHPDQAGVRPSDADDFDGVCTIGERWLVVTATE